MNIVSQATPPNLVVIEGVACETTVQVNSVLGGTKFSSESCPGGGGGGGQYSLENNVRGDISKRGHTTL